jgi:hypothetical protein
MTEIWGEASAAKSQLRKERIAIVEQKPRRPGRQLRFGPIISAK